MTQEIKTLSTLVAKLDKANRLAEICWNAQNFHRYIKLARLGQRLIDEIGAYHENNFKN